MAERRAQQRRELITSQTAKTRLTDSAAIKGSLDVPVVWETEAEQSQAVSQHFSPQSEYETYMETHASPHAPLRVREPPAARAYVEQHGMPLPFADQSCEQEGAEGSNRGSHQRPHATSPWPQQRSMPSVGRLYMQGREGLMMQPAQPSTGSYASSRGEPINFLQPETPQATFARWNLAWP